MLADHRTAPISDKLRAMLVFLEKMTQHPDDLCAVDARALLDAGVSRAAARQAIYVAYVFNIYDRMADSLGFAMPNDDYKQVVWALLRIGYRC